eukprot:scaffold157692_cov30-Tisochrysis_lutea.AAC.2
MAGSVVNGGRVRQPAEKRRKRGREEKGKRARARSSRYVARNRQIMRMQRRRRGGGEQELRA